MTLPAHSPLGASSAERWLNCPGSVTLAKAVEGQTSNEEDPEYRRDGTAAHAALAWCLTEGRDAWEAMGQTFEGVEIDDDIGLAIQVFIDHVRPLMRAASRVFIETKMHRPDFHPLFFGTVDFAAITEEGTHLHVRDYKHGEGIFVPIMGNEQTMYYAYGILIEFPLVKTVTMGIVQPRYLWNDGGPIREVTVDADTIRAWAEFTLRPGMERATHQVELQESTFVPGDWCRFCPGKLLCPAVGKAFDEMGTSDPAIIPKLDNDMLDLIYPLIGPVKGYIKALEAEVFARLQHGKKFAHAKLVRKKADRVYREGAEDALKAGADVLVADLYSQPSFLSPAQMEKLSGKMKQLVREWAYTPDVGFTVASTDDARQEVVVQSTAELFPNATKG